MANKRNCPLLEASESLNIYRESFREKQQKKIDKAAKEREAIEEQIYFGTKEKNRIKKKVYSEYCTNLKNKLLANAIRGIYIGALQENTALTDNGMLLAFSLVDNYIKESGGATNILSKISGKTYALDYIRSVVEGTYSSILEDVDPEDEESMEAPEEKEEEMYDDMSKDDDISNAVDLIAKRITDAEEEFIRKNNEDKKTLEDIANRFSERIKDVEDDATIEDEDKEELQQESSRIARRKSNDLRVNRTRNVFEQIVINLTESILKDENLKLEYMDDGRLNMASVIESAKCIYGLLETVNTLQLQRIDSKYIENILTAM